MLCVLGKVLQKIEPRGDSFSVRPFPLGKEVMGANKFWWTQTNPSLVRALSTLNVVPYFVKENAATVDCNFW